MVDFDVTVLLTRLRNPPRQYYSRLFRPHTILSAIPARFNPKSSLHPAFTSLPSVLMNGTAKLGVRQRECRVSF
jgi:hypothetical protein